MNNYEILINIMINFIYQPHYLKANQRNNIFKITKKINWITKHKHWITSKEWINNLIVLMPLKINIHFKKIVNSQISI